MTAAALTRFVRSAAVRSDLSFLAHAARRSERRCQKINHARSATLATTTKTNAKLPNPCTAWDENATARIGCDNIDDGFPFLGRKQAFRVGQIARRLTNGVHADAFLRHRR